MTVEYAPGYAAQHSTERSLFAVLAFIAFLLLIFVGLEAFSPPAAVSRFGGPSRGDAMRQVSFVAVTALVVFAAYQRQYLCIGIELHLVPFLIPVGNCISQHGTAFITLVSMVVRL